MAKKAPDGQKTLQTRIEQASESDLFDLLACKAANHWILGHRHAVSGHCKAACQAGLYESDAPVAAYL